MTPYVQRIVRWFEALHGAEISGWTGVEMALTEGRSGGEMWEASSVPYLQMLFIEFAQVDGTHVRISTEQADEVWGLCIGGSTDGNDREADWNGIYRKKALSCLPSGRIKPVDVAIMDGLISKVSFVIGESNVQMSPGEVYEDWDGTFRVVEQDESVLVQVDGAHPRQNKTVVDNRLPVPSRNDPLRYNP